MVEMDRWKDQGKSNDPIFVLEVIVRWKRIKKREFKVLNFEYGGKENDSKYPKYDIFEDMCHQVLFLTRIKGT